MKQTFVIETKKGISDKKLLDFIEKGISKDNVIFVEEISEPLFVTNVILIGLWIIIYLLIFFYILWVC